MTLPKSAMHGYQNRAATKLYESDAVQAVMPMGSGKTVSALTAIKELIDDGHIRCAIINAPKRVAQLVWPTEIKNWEHLTGLRISLVTGTADERLLALAANADVYVTSRDNIKWLVATLKSMPESSKFFDLLCVDELSRFKSPSSKLANKHLGTIIGRFRIRWGLTGTPRPNDYIDQYRPCQLLTNNMLFKPRTFTSWRAKHFIKVDGDGKPSEYGFKWKVRPQSEHQIIKQISSISFTVDPDEMPELPELTTVVHWVDLPPKVMAYYRQMERDLITKAGSLEKVFLAANAGVASGKLEQIVQGFIYGDGGNTDVEHLHTEKADQLVDLVEDLAGQPALLVYGFVEDLRVMQALYDDEPDGAPLPYLGAGTSDAKAAIYEREWNENKLELLALHPASAGHGLNLQHGGNQMIHYNLTWSAELFDQIRKRYWRQGQLRRCFEHLILARDTIDELKYDRVVGKMTDQEAFNRYLKRI